MQGRRSQVLGTKATGVVSAHASITRKRRQGLSNPSIGIIVRPCHNPYCVIPGARSVRFCCSKSLAAKGHHEFSLHPDLTSCPINAFFLGIAISTCVALAVLIQSTVR